MIGLGWACQPEWDADDLTPRVGEACDDPTPCSIGGICTVDGLCVTAAPICDDGIDCTVDPCMVMEGWTCDNAPDDAQCDDGVFCNGKEVCVPRRGCAPGPVVTCQDGDPCTIDTCVEDGKALAALQFYGGGHPMSHADMVVYLRSDLDAGMKLVLAAAITAILQAKVPSAVLVGGTAAALHAGHRVSFDHDHVLKDLALHFDKASAALESIAGWRTRRRIRGKLVLGEIEGIDAGLRNQRRSAPLETISIKATMRSPSEPRMTIRSCFLR